MMTSFRDICGEMSNWRLQKLMIMRIIMLRRKEGKARDIDDRLKRIRTRDLFSPPFSRTKMQSEKRRVLGMELGGK